MSERPLFWGQEMGGPALPWEWAEERLAKADVYWLTTVSRALVPRSRPVWGVWVDDRLVLSVGSNTHGYNIRVNPAASAHLSSGLEVVIIEGTAAFENDAAVLERMVEPYNAKYRWNFTPNTTGPVITLTPTVVLAWLTHSIDESAPASGFPTGSARWTFPR